MLSAITLAQNNGMVGHWSFDNPDDLTAAEIGNPLQLTGTHTAIQGYTQSDGAVTIGVGSYYTVQHGIAPNGNGTKVNQYTVVMDVRFHDLGQWYALFQTDSTNVSDGDWFISSSGKLGIKAVGYTSKKLIPNKWYRIAASVSNGNRFDYYINGKKVLSGTPQNIDERFALGSEILFFADENGEDNSIDVADIKLFSKDLNDDEIAALGGYPTLELIAPNGGEQWKVNSQQTILWESTQIETINIEYSTDSMNTWQTIAENVSAADGGYAWNLPSNPEESVFLKLTDVNDTSIYDISNHAFSIIEENVGLGLVGHWTFDNPDSLTVAESGNDLILTGTHSAVEGPAENDGAVSIGPGSFYTIEHGIAPNGGGTKVNSYTLMMDIKISEDGLWYALMQTDTTNSNDADWFVSSKGKLGIKVTGYSNPVVFANKWYRIAISIANGNKHDYYVNGVKVKTGVPQDIDGRFALTSKLLLFADESAEDNQITVSDIKLFSRALTDEEIAGFGGFPTIQITSPNGDEYWTTGSFPRITWQSKNVSIVKIEFSSDNGTTWETLSPATPAINGEYTKWKIPDNLNSDSCLIKITKQDNPKFFDISDKVFKIVTTDKTENIVVLGSSTAAGTGPSSPDSAWVNRYRKYIFSKNTTVKVINLAVGGYTTYQLMPDGFTPPQGKPKPDVAHNITKAISFNPKAIIINLPSNDVANGFSVQEQLANYDSILAKAAEVNIPVWISTTQPRNFSEEKRTMQVEMRDSTFARFGKFAIDFWSGIADSNNKIKPEFNSGDGVHLNNAGHRILFERVVAKQIYEQTILPTSVERVGKKLPTHFKLYQNFPNPFNPTTKIQYSINVDSFIRLNVFDILGKEVSTLVNKKQPAGTYQVTFNANNLPSGVYFYKLQAGSFVKTKKLLLLK